MQKQSTVGFIALMYLVPIISYNVYRTDYSDQLYEPLGISNHCNDLVQVFEAVKCMDSNVYLKKIQARQNASRDDYCQLHPSPCKNIVSVIQNHFVGSLH